MRESRRPPAPVMRAVLLAGLLTTFFVGPSAGREVDPGEYRTLLDRVDLVTPALRAMGQLPPSEGDLYLLGFAGDLPVEALRLANVEFLRVHERDGTLTILARTPRPGEARLHELPTVERVEAYTPRMKIDPQLGRLPYHYPEDPDERRAIDAEIYPAITLATNAPDGRLLRVPRIKVAVRLCADADVGATVPLLEANGLKIDPKEPPLDAESLKMVYGYLDLDAALAGGTGTLEALARLPEVDFIEEILPFAFVMSAESQEVLQSGDVDLGRPYWDAGIKGAGQVVALLDGGLDLDVRAMSQTDSDAGNHGPSHRKVLDYRAYGGGNLQSCNGYSHGSNTAQNAAGDRAYHGYDDHTDGIAPRAKVFFGDIGKGPSCGNSVYPPGDLTGAFQDMYDAGARMENNSWGQLFGSSYNAHAQQADSFMWENKTFLVFWSAGNGGSVKAPATFKSGICVGGFYQDPNQNSRYGSSGGAVGGRTAPLVMAPASDSSGVGGNPFPNDYDTSAYWQSGDADINGDLDESISQNHSGTSFASPMAMGATALIRDYFTQGFYPSGTKTVEDEIDTDEISGALVKAVLINSGEPMTCSGCLTRPNYYVGMGRIVLTNTLPLSVGGVTADTPPSLFVEDRGQAVGLQTGETYLKDLGLIAGGADAEALRVTLVWTDRPGSSLTNDLRLVVRTPDGDVYYGNNFSGEWSEPASLGGTSNDTNNPFESVMIGPGDVISGTYRIEVQGASVANGDPDYGNSQPFAVVASGRFGNPVPVAVRGLRHEATSETTQRLTWEALFGGDTTYNVYRGTHATLAGGVYDHLPVACGLTETFHDVEDLGDGEDYYYLVTARNGAGEGSYGTDGAGEGRPPSPSPCP